MNLKQTTFAKIGVFTAVLTSLVMLGLMGFDSAHYYIYFIIALISLVVLLFLVVILKLR